MVETINIQEIDDWLDEASTDAIVGEFFRRLFYVDLKKYELEMLSGVLECNGYVSVLPKYLQDEEALKEKIKELGL